MLPSSAGSIGMSGSNLLPKTMRDEPQNWGLYIVYLLISGIEG